MRKRLIFALLILIMLGGIGYIYVNNFFLPVKFKNFIENKASIFLNRKVAIDQIRFEFVNGFYLNGITIYEDESDQKKFLSITQANFNILLAPLFQNKNIIIPRVKVKGLHVHLIRHANNTWNFSELLDKPKVKEQDKTYNLLLRKILIKGGKVDFFDYTIKPKFFESVKSIDLELILSIEKKVKYKLTANLDDMNTTLMTDGEYDLSDKLISSTVQYTNIPIIRYLPFFTNEPNLKNGLLSYGDLTVTYADKLLAINGHTSMENALWEINRKQSIGGNINLDNINLEIKNKLFTAKGNIIAPDLNITLDKNAYLKTNLNGNISDLRYHDNELNLTGDLKLDQSEFNLNASQSYNANVSLPALSLTYGDGEFLLNSPLQVTDAQFDMDTNRRFKGDISTEKTTLTYKDGTLTIESDIKANDVDLKINENAAQVESLSSKQISLTRNPEEVQFSSDLTFKNLDALINKEYKLTGNPMINISYSLSNTFGAKPTIQGTVQLNSANLSNIPHVENISDVKGIFAFTQDSLKTDGWIDFTTQEMELGIAGSVSDLTKLNAHIEIATPPEGIDLAKAHSIYTQFSNNLDLNITGTTIFKTIYTGSLKDFSLDNFIFNGSVQNTELLLPSLNEPIKSISGKLSFADNRIYWSGLQGQYQNRLYTLSGNLDNPSRPKVNTHIEADSLDLWLKLNILRRALQITSLKGTYLRNEIDIMGDVHFPEEKDLTLDLRGSVKVNLLDLPKILPQHEEAFNKHRLTGTLIAEGLFKGNPKQWKDWNLTFEAESPNLVFDKYRFNQTQISFSQRDNYISQFDINSNIYGGKIDMKSSIDINDSELPMYVDALFEDLDLNELRKGQGIKAKQFAGSLSLIGKFQVPLTSWKRVQGDGSLVVADGYLWHLIPQYYDINFTDFESSFTIRNQKILTNDARLISQFLILNANGFIDFSQNYDFNITPQTLDGQAGEMDALKILRQVVSIKCDGNFRNKKINCKPEVNILQTPADLIQGVGGILEGLL